MTYDMYPPPHMTYDISIMILYAGKADEVRAKQPKQIKKKRPLMNEEGLTTGHVNENN